LIKITPTIKREKRGLTGLVEFVLSTSENLDSISITQKNFREERADVTYCDDKSESHGGEIVCKKRVIPTLIQSPLLSANHYFLFS
jgi:hypothetical protein